MNIDMIKTCFDRVRSESPLIHNITNYVTVNDVANMILACGGSPIMADDPEEVEEITSICGGLNINIGTLNQRTIQSMVLAGKKGAELGHPMILDPVGAGASELRTKTALSLMEEIPFQIIRGNISEIKILANAGGHSHGVDASDLDAVTEDNLEEATEFAKEFAREHGVVLAITGAIDIVTDGNRWVYVRLGRREMGNITGTGCQLTGLMAAFATANKENIFESAVTAVMAMGAAGEIAWNKMQPGDGNATYRNRIIDAISNMTGDSLAEYLTNME